MIEPAVAPKVTTRPARRRLSAVLKVFIASVFLFVTGGPAVIAQYDESNPAIFWRLDRERMKNRVKAKVRQKKAVVQRPTRLIRGTAPRRGFTLVVPEGEQPAQQNPGSENPADNAGQPAAVPSAPDAASAPAAPSQTAQPAAPAAKQEPSVRIAVLGDNVGQLLARGLEMAYADRPQIAVVRATRDSSGLVNTRFYDWNDNVRKLLATGVKPDIALMMLGSNDAQDIVDGSNRHKPRSDEWAKIYKSRIEAIVKQFREKNIPLLWVGMPIMRGERLSGEMLSFNEIYRDTVQRAGGAYVDIWEAFVDDRNRFSLFGPDLNGQIVKLRTGDGVHFTAAGARKLAHFVEGQLKKLIDERQPRTDPVVAALPSPAPPVSRNTPSPSRPLPGTQATTKPDPQAMEPPGRPAETALTRPAATPVPAAPPRPVAGPVIRLTAPAIASDGTLATRQNRAAANARAATLARAGAPDGLPARTEPGRADDFRWPRNN